MAGASTIRLRPLVPYWILLCAVSLAAGGSALKAANYPWNRAHAIGAVNAIVGAATLWCVTATILGLRQVQRAERARWGVYTLVAILAGVLAGQFAMTVLLAAVVVSGDASVGEIVQAIAEGEANSMFAGAGAIGGAVGLVFGVLWTIPLARCRRAKEE